MASIVAQTHLKDTDEWRATYGRDRSFTALSVDSDRSQLFITSREQMERLFDVVAEMAMRWREWQPDTVTLDAEIERLCPECGEVWGPGGRPCEHLSV